MTSSTKISEMTNHTLYAHWTAKKYTVYLDANGGSLTGKSISVTYDSAYEGLPIPTRNGYGFDGWFTSANGGEKISSSTMVSITSDQTLYAHWTAGRLTVTYNGNGGTPSSQAVSVEYNSTYGGMPSVTRSGYNFTGWYTSKSGGARIQSNTKVTISDDHSLYAHWNPVTLKVSFDANGGTVSTAFKNVTFNSSYGNLPVPTRPGYNFIGWFTYKDGGNKIVSDSVVSTAGNHTLYAHWTMGKFTVTFDSNGGSVTPASIKVTYNSTYGTLPTPVRNGYRFDGWFTSKSGGKKITSSSKVTISFDQILYAKWTAIYTVSLNPNGGSVSTYSLQVASKSAYGELPVPKRTGYRFSGWYTKLSGGTKITSDTIITTEADHTLYAHWTQRTCTVHFDNSSGAISFTEKQVAYGGAYGDLPASKRSGYHIAGWFTEKNGGTQIKSDTIVDSTSDHTLYPHWAADKYKVSFDGRGGTPSFYEKDVKFNSDYGDLPSAQRDYCDFLGWYTSDGERVYETTKFSSTSNVTLYAFWKDKVISEWVKIENMPRDAQRINTKWTYTAKTTMDSRNENEPGYYPSGSEWVESGSGSKNYASFPGGFDTNNWYYQNWNGGPYGEYENNTSKRVVSNNWAGFIYWHWMYNCNQSTAYNRAIWNQSGICNVYPNYGYWFFGAFNSTNDYPVQGYNHFCNSCGMTTYKIEDRRSYDESQGSYYWFRFDYYESYYKDYYKLFHYYKEENKESYNRPTESPTVYNITEWVQYRAK